ncbi:MAG: hypothetical protein JXR76_14315 [Deltaproteobacteria bacterium]|nr:hypothetical protein [Deltaproteobacteria bacterium]
MIKNWFILFILVVVISGCEGEFLGKLETDSASKELEPSESAVSNLEADANLPQDCQTGDVICDGDRVMLCLLGSWGVAVDCQSGQATCTVEQGTPMCVKISTVDESTDSSNASADTENSTDSDRIWDTAPECRLKDDACYNSSDSPCMPRFAAPGQLDCASWAVLYGPCVDVTQDCKDDRGCVILESCVSIALMSASPETLIQRCLDSADAITKEMYLDVAECVFCEACSIACDTYFPDSMCDSADVL